jgi:hypothetical protein
VTGIPTSEQLRHVVQAAGLAPSVHNTQPWRFEARPDGLALYADPSRQLGVLDPDGRQLHLSCGAALFHARIAARALGFDVRVRLLTDPSRPEHLADLTLVPGRQATPDEVRLATAILHRHTHRGPFDDRPVPTAVLDRLRLDVEAEGAVIDVVVKADDLIALEVLLSRADAQLEHEPEYREELAQWVHTGPLQADGIPVEALETASGSPVRQRDFTLTQPDRLDGSSPRVDHPSIVVLATVDDSQTSWLKAGQALAALLLRAADHGVQAQPLGQVTDVLAYRLGLRSALGMLALPQLVLRMGYAAHSPVTPRRTVEDVLVGVPE